MVLKRRMKRRTDRKLSTGKEDVNIPGMTVSNLTCVWTQSGQADENITLETGFKINLEDSAAAALKLLLFGPVSSDLQASAATLTHFGFPD